ncbi:MAG: hypothetical protein IT307_16235 [Chloroflexi bacterium]|nr:hypothetical protein [Chloroflexota bacterium]
MTDQGDGHPSRPDERPPTQRPIVPVWLFLAVVVLGSTAIWLLARASSERGSDGDSGVLLLAIFGAAFAVYVASRYITGK